MANFRSKLPFLFLVFPSIAGLLKDATLTRIIPTDTFVEFIFITSLVQIAVAVIANSIYITAASRFKATGEIVYPIDNTTTSLTISALLTIVVIACAHQNAIKELGPTGVVGHIAIISMYFAISLATSLQSTLLSTTNAKAYLLSPILSHISIITFATLGSKTPATLLAAAITGAQLESLLLYASLKKKSGIIKLKLSRSKFQSRSAPLAAILNSAAPLITQIAAHNLTSVGYLSYIYGLKISNTLSTLAASVIGATYFHIVLDTKFLKNALTIGGATLILTTATAAVAYPFPLDFWLGEKFMTQMGSEFQIAYLSSWIFLGINILTSIYYRKCLIEAPRKLLSIKACTVTLSLLTIQMASYGLLALIATQCIIFAIEAVLYVNLSGHKKFSN